MSNQIRIACRCRKALVRRIAEAGMTERKHLPVGLVRRRQKIYKSRAVLPMVPTPCGEGSEVTCASTPLERLNISFSPLSVELLLL